MWSDFSKQSKNDSIQTASFSSARQRSRSQRINHRTGSAPSCDRIGCQGNPSHRFENDNPKDSGRLPW